MQSSSQSARQKEVDGQHVALARLQQREPRSPGSWPGRPSTHTRLYTVTRNTLLLLKGTLHVWGDTPIDRVPSVQGWSPAWCFLQGTDKREGR